MSLDQTRVIDIIGEGKSHAGQHSPGPQPPTSGVVTILVHTLCGRPANMRVRRRGFPHLERRGFKQKVIFAKRQASLGGSAGAVCVVDSEGDERELKQRSDTLHAGRNHELPDFPMAVGVAHPCIEAWLLADATAIRQGLGLAEAPDVPGAPEDLPAPCRDKSHNPKTVLAGLAHGSTGKGDLSADEKDRIARAMDDMGLVRERCPLGFGPFAEEVEERIGPLF